MGELQLLAQPNKWCLLQVATAPKYWCPDTTDSLKNGYCLTQKISYLSFCRLWNPILSLVHLGQGYFTEETTTTKHVYRRDDRTGETGFIDSTDNELVLHGRKESTGCVEYKQECTTKEDEQINRKKQDFCTVREDGVASSWASKGKSENQGKCGPWLEESKTVK